MEISAQMRPLSQGRFQLRVFAHFVEAPTCFRFRFFECFLLFFLFSSRLSRFFIVALLLCFFFLGKITLINYFYQSRQMGPMATGGCVAHFAHLFGVSVPINDQIFLSPASLFLSALLFYAILCGMQVNGMCIL